MSIVRYKDYQAKVEFEDNCLVIHVLHINDFLAAECDQASDVQGTFENLIDEYLSDCEELGHEPDKPFKGSFNVRIAPESHRQAAMAAAARSETLNAWVTAAIHDKIVASRTSTRLTADLFEILKKSDFFSVNDWLPYNAIRSGSMKALARVPGASSHHERTDPFSIGRMYNVTGSGDIEEEWETRTQKSVAGYFRENYSQGRVS